MKLCMPTRRRKLWLWALGFVLVAAASAYAVQQSATVEVRWKVLPYQTLRLLESGDEISAVRYTVPESSALDVSRGYIEDENAVRLHVVSNTSWKVQVRAERVSGFEADLLVRRHGDAYFEVTESPAILARGSHGTFDLGVDYRIPIGGAHDLASEGDLQIVYTLMSD